MPILSHLFIITTISSSLIPLSASHRHSLDDVCRLTRHHALCIRVLSSSSHPGARQSMKWWARAAVSATLCETEHVYKYLRKIKEGKRHIVKAEALSDCVECFGDSTMQLHETVGEMRQLQTGREFGLQMNDVETWVSAVLTNQDTCYEGLADWRGPLAERVRGRVLNATYFTSNALALVNKLASEGGSG